MRLSTLRRYESTARAQRVIIEQGIGGQVGRREVIGTYKCFIRVLNKLGWAEIIMPERLNTDMEWLRWDTLTTPSGELVFPIQQDGVLGKDFKTFDCTPVIDPWGNIIEWKYTVTQNPSGS